MGDLADYYAEQELGIGEDEMTDEQSTENVWARLAAPFPAHEIKWRVGSTTKDKKKGMMLAYIDARCVMDRLDEEVGPGNWQSEMTMCHDGRTSCTISVLVEHGAVTPPEWVKRTDIAGATDMEGAKGGASDALKRAAVQLGVGRYLYHLDSPWVELEAKGRSHVMKKSEMPKLLRALGVVSSGPALGQMSTGPMSPEEYDEPVAPPAQQPRAQGTGATSSPPSQGRRDEIIDIPTKKQLYGANFEALKQAGFSEGQVKAMVSAEKFAPLNFACDQAGVTRVEHLYFSQVAFVKGAMVEWTAAQAGSSTPSIDTDPPPEAYEEPGSFDDQF